MSQVTSYPYPQQSPTFARRFGQFSRNSFNRLKSVSRYTPVGQIIPSITKAYNELPIAINDTKNAAEQFYGGFTGEDAGNTVALRLQRHRITRPGK